MKSSDETCRKLMTECEEIRVGLGKRRDRIHQAALKVLDDYDIVFIPKLDVKGCIGKKGLPNDVKSRLQFLSHSSFLEKLQTRKAKTGGSVVIVDEAFSTKLMTCCNQNYLNYGVGAGKRSVCSKCGCSVDRDVNGARNILLFALARSMAHWVDKLTPPPLPTSASDGQTAAGGGDSGQTDDKGNSSVKGNKSIIPFYYLL